MSVPWTRSRILLELPSSSSERKHLTLDLSQNSLSLFGFQEHHRAVFGKPWLEGFGECLGEVRRGRFLSGLDDAISTVSFGVRLLGICRHHDEYGGCFFSTSFAVVAQLLLWPGEAFSGK